MIDGDRVGITGSRFGQERTEWLAARRGGGERRLMLIIKDQWETEHHAVAQAA